MFAKKLFISGILILFFVEHLIAQYTPVPVTGFNEDVIAEAGPSSLATTSNMLDAAASNKVMYTESFKNFAGLAGGGLPDAGMITNGSMTFNLADYTSNNALCLKRGEIGILSLVQPSSFARLRILCFATEANVSPANALVNISLTFTDGTTVPYILNYGLADWFNSSSNLVTSGFGRCSRVASAPWGEEAYPSNPRMYYIEITLNCPDIQKDLQSLEFSNVTTAGSNAPFPNEVFLAVSGIAYSQLITPVIAPCDCAGVNGSIALNITGSSGPYSYAWNTVPVQTGATATGLNPGTYTCTITDANGCTTVYSGDVPLNNNSSVIIVPDQTVMCPGSPNQLSAVFSGPPLTNFSWTPGNETTQSINISPTITTNYTVTATNAIGCSGTAQITIVVDILPSQPVANDLSICSGTSGTLAVQNPLANITYNWYDALSGGALLGSGNLFNTPVLTSTTVYYLEAVSPIGCQSASRTAVTVEVASLPLAPEVDDVTICAGDDALLTVTNPQTGYVYNWYDAATAGTLLGTGTSYTAAGVAVQTTIYTEVISNTGCIGTTRASVDINFAAVLASPAVSATNIDFTSLTFSWQAVPGAIGYEVSTDGGITFTIPSSGTYGTTHTVSGLTGNTTITIVVRALGVLPCENSSLSVPVSGTTLSTKEIFVPNVFTPNGDGINDLLNVYGNYMSAIQFMVFNQWGEKIFQTNKIGEGWDGTQHGKKQPSGVYAYVLRVILQDGTVVNKKGSINLIR